jgi:hypothetical protein
MRKITSGILVLAALAGFAEFTGFAQEPPEDFFTGSVEPLLSGSCLSCHNQKVRSSGLALDARQDVLTGGNRGPAITAGSPDSSLIIQAVEQTGDLKMPPKGKLSGQQIAVLRRWIEQGAVWPSTGSAAKDTAGRDHWAFQQPMRATPPKVRNARWVRNPLDQFILAKLEAEGIAPSPETDRATLLRRVSLDLTGLPPTAEELNEFLNDRSAKAYEKVVDRLLASPHYGERWGRRWLDLARYADSDGYTIDDPRHIWPYRDWVIDALNRDLPFDQFTIEQIAGDLLPNPTQNQLIATGFHRNTPSNYEGGIDHEQYRVEAVADRVATTGAVFLGLTLGCARCHDHKYDPIQQKEFYQLFAYFNSTDAITRESQRPQHNRPKLELPTPEQAQAAKQYHSDLFELNDTIAERLSQLSVRPGASADDPADAEVEKDEELRKLLAERRRLRANPPVVNYTLIMRELREPRESYIHLGGDFLRKGIVVKPGVPAALSTRTRPAGTSRLDLARWLVDPGNPLTARVTINRFWEAYFGRGIVASENDFGLAGDKPTHPELLDWLAAEFMDRGWSQKAIHRLIVTSAAYRQSSNNREDLGEKDPYNYLLARQTRLRLEAEIVRDAALVASGLLNPTVGGPSVFPPMPVGSMALTQVRKPWPTDYGPNRFRRGLYTFTYRASLHPAMSLFDAPDGSTTCTRRVRSNSPLQALVLLNDTAYLEFARGLAEKVLAKPATSDVERISTAFVRAVGRKPRPPEAKRMSEFLASQRQLYQADPSLARRLLRNERGALEAEQVSAVEPVGAQSAVGRADSLAMAARAAEVKQAALKATTAYDALSEAEAIELASWTAVSRVLLNVDDFVTRN